MSKWLHKSMFNAGNPYSCWLREMMSSLLASYPYDKDSKELLDRFHIDPKEMPDLFIFVMEIAEKLDDYPPHLKPVAVEVIRKELDPTFHL